MKKTVRVVGIGIMLFSSFLILSAWTGSDSANIAGGGWEAPASADKLENPLKDNADATAKGKKIYKQMCEICHGSKGKGDGMAGAALNPRPANFIQERVQGQTDGAIYWKLTEGRPPMASYRNILKEDQRWQLVNYIRTLKK